MSKHLRFLPSALILSLIILISACDEEIVIPTIASTAVAPTQEIPTVTPRIIPTLVTIAPTQTRPATPTPTVTPVIPEPDQPSPFESGVNITSPNEGAELLQGDEVSVGGLVHISAGETFSVTLSSATGRELALADVDVHQFSNWEGKILVPVSVSGSAKVVASIVDSSGNIVAQDSHEVNLILNPEITETYLELFRPIKGENVVAGFNMFFDGRAQGPVNNIVAISLWKEECQVLVGRQSFVLRGSGYWQGFLVIPWTETGPMCAVAHFGEPGADAWREAQVTINVLSPEDSEAKGVVVGNPPADSEIPPDSSLLIYGTSYNTPAGEVHVTVRTEDGRVLTEGITETDIYGYWELSLFIPAGISGVAEISASVGDEDEDIFAEHRILIHIGPLE